MNKYLSFCLYIWQLPQIVLGLLCLIVFHNYQKYTNPYNKVEVLRICTGSSLGTICFSLGPMIFTPEECPPEVLLHETGHSKQSQYLGPLFLLAVAVPSCFLFWYRRIFSKSMSWYNSKYPESWANTLGGVNEYKNKG